MISEDFDFFETGIREGASTTEVEEDEEEGIEEEEEDGLAMP